MARLFPFRALRYDPTRVNMTDVVTQPYDKIDTAMQDRYYAASPYNLIRVILGRKFPEDKEEGPNVYTRAAATLTDWRKEGILKEETEPALYGYSQTYTVPGTTEVRERRGFIGLGQLHDYADKVVYRHEQTFPKHKSDRLALFKPPAPTASRSTCSTPTPPSPPRRPSSNPAASPNSKSPTSTTSSTASGSSPIPV